MNSQEIRTTVLTCLRSIAPEADLSALPGTADLRDELDIDSMDFLRFVIELHDKLHVDIPEQDYRSIRTLDACVAYLASRSG